MKRVLALASVAVVIAGVALQLAPAQPAPAARPVTDSEKKGLDYLLKVQEKDGAWVPQVGPAITGMVVKALVQSGRKLDDPAVKKGLDFIETCKQKDGGYYHESNPNYNSSVILSTFAMLPGDAYKAKITGLQTFLKSLQLDESKDESGKPLAAVPNGKAISKTNSWYGGAGYGEDRPDLSNTAYFMEALHESGIPGSDPAMQKALIFVSHSQMNGETNNLEFAKGSTNGGFIYTPVEGGVSKFGDIDKLEGGSELRSYGSMSYSGFKSLLYAGLTEQDPRVKAAVKWIGSNWTLEINPGSASFDGQYYYYHAFAKALYAWKHDEITDSKGIKHNWRNELIDTLKTAQKPDGSWANTRSDRWFESNPVLATSYAVLALQEARK